MKLEHLKIRVYGVQKGGINVAKKKRRYQKHKRSPSRQPQSRCDSHHLLWLRAEWSRGVQKELRNHHYCIMELPKDTLHHYIHTRVSRIPLPSETSARYVLDHLKYLSLIGAIKDSDPIEKRLNLLINLFDYIEPATAIALKKQLQAVHEYKNNPSL